MRLFVAAPIPDPARRRLGELAGSLCRGMERGKPTPTENLHLTLHFLGEADPEAACRAVMAARFTLFVLAFTHIGRFRREEGDIVWAGTAQSAELAALHAALGDALRGEGFAPDTRAFRPHLTLARRVRVGGCDLAAVGRGYLPVRVGVERIVLMESVFEGGGVVYREVVARGARGDLRG